MKKLLILLFAVLYSLPSDAQPAEEWLTWDNRPRKFITFLPEDYNPEVQMPLVINMHPFLMNGGFQMWYTRFNGLADTAGVVVVYPWGINGRWNSGSFFGIPQPVDDVGFLSALIDYMAVIYNIDTRRVYATGYSAGGYMSYALGCHIPNRIAAIAPVSASMNPDLVEICNPDRPMPTMVFNGTTDAIVEYDGSPAAAGVDDIMLLWQTINGCNVEPSAEELPNTNTSDNTTTTKYTYNNCDNNSELLLYKIINGGHTWPGRPFPLLGNTSLDVNANEEIWEFFQRHQIPEDIACARPTGLSIAFQGNMASLSWDAVPGIETYSLFYALPGEAPVYIQDIINPSYELQTDMVGEFAWTVRSECESGHVSWSTIRRDNISGRLPSGRLAMNTYPNPASDLLHLEFQVDRLPDAVSIINAYGFQVMSVPVRNEKITLDISTLENGVFHVVTDGWAYDAATIRKW